MSLIIYTKKETTRLNYAVNLLFKWVYKLDFKLTTDIKEVETFTGAKLNFSVEELTNCLQIDPARLIFEREVKSPFLKMGKWEELPIFFETKGDIPFDVFSAAFYLAVRYEEYTPHKTDDLGRFDFKDSLAFKENFLQLPLINLWAAKLLEKLKEKFPSFNIPQKKYKFVPTIDVDNTFAYKNKGFVRTAGAYTRSFFSGDFEDVVERSQVIFGNKPDPFDVFEKIIEIEKKYHLKQLLFFLLGDYDVNDKNVPPGNKNFQRLIKDVNDYVEVGIHPSFASNQQREKLKLEIDRLSSITHRDVTKSRQHFLVLKFPTTYRNLIETGITDDYSMGYPQHPGFRASIADVYPFYDLELEKETKLMIHPFAAMEATFKYYQSKKPNEVVAEITKIAEEVKKVNGVFYLLWHSDTLSGHKHWKGWQNLYEEVLNACAKI